jgi:hypothetical protein
MEREKQIALFLRWRDYNDSQATHELYQAACEQIKTAKMIFAYISYVYEEDALSNLIDDIINDTFLEVTKNLKKFKPNSSACFTTYCVGIAKNIARRIRDKNRKKPLNFSSLDPIIIKKPKLQDGPFWIK